MPLSTTWTWIRQIFRKLSDVRLIECQKMVFTCWVSTSPLPNLNFIHFHNGNRNGFAHVLLVPDWPQSRQKPFTGTAAFQRHCVLREFYNVCHEKKKNNLTRGKKTCHLCQARENMKPVPSARKWEKNQLLSSQNFVCCN